MDQSVKYRNRTLASMIEVMGPFVLESPRDAPAVRNRTKIESIPIAQAGSLDSTRVTIERIEYEAVPSEWVPAYLLYTRDDSFRYPPGVPGKPGGYPILALHQTTSVGKAEPAGLSGIPGLHYGYELAARGNTVLSAGLSYLRPISLRSLRPRIQKHDDDGNNQPRSGDRSLARDDRSKQGGGHRTLPRWTQRAFPFGL